MFVHMVTFWMNEKFFYYFDSKGVYFHKNSSKKYIKRGKLLSFPCFATNGRCLQNFDFKYNGTALNMGAYNAQKLRLNTVS